jgi:hypothetical protein
MQKGPQCLKFIVNGTSEMEHNTPQDFNKARIAQYFTHAQNELIKQKKLPMIAGVCIVLKKKKDCIAFISDLRLNLSTRAGLRPDTNELLRASRLYITVVHEAA